MYAYPEGSPAAQSHAATCLRIAPLLAFAQETLANQPAPITEKTALFLIMQVVMRDQLQYAMHEINEAVRQIMLTHNRVMDLGPPHHLTVGHLRERMAGLPDNTPVLYQRIQDAHFDQGGWKTHALPWESRDYDPEIDAQVLAQYPESHRLLEVDGKQVLQQLTEYIPAFSCYTTTDEHDGTALCIHAHY